MILCPFCGSEMADEAKSCPSCRSILVEREPGKAKPFPVFLHPLAALAAIVVLSAGLFALSLHRAGKEEQPAPAAAAPPADAASGRPAPRKAVRLPGDEESYQKILEYERALTALLNQLDAITADMDVLRKTDSKENRAKLAEKLALVNGLREKVKALQPPRQLNTCHNHFRTHVDLMYRSYSNHILYFEGNQSDIGKLSQARADYDKAQKYREQAKAELAEEKKKLAPPEPEPPPPPEKNDKPTTPVEPQVKPPPGPPPPVTPPEVAPAQTPAENQPAETPAEDSTPQTEGGATAEPAKETPEGTETKPEGENGEAPAENGHQ